MRMVERWNCGRGASAEARRMAGMTAVSVIRAAAMNATGDSFLAIFEAPYLRARALNCKRLCW
jgi:hypothetical protein